MSKEVLLSCGHTNVFYPAPYDGDLVFCWSCNDFRKVIGGSVFKDQTKMECQQCTYRKTWSCDVDEVRTRAETHAIRHGHTVIIFSMDGEQIAVINP